MPRPGRPPAPELGRTHTTLSRSITSSGPGTNEPVPLKNSWQARSEGKRYSSEPSHSAK